MFYICMIYKSIYVILNEGKNTNIKKIIIVKSKLGSSTQVRILCKSHCGSHKYCSLSYHHVVIHVSQVVDVQGALSSTTVTPWGAVRGQWTLSLLAAWRQLIVGAVWLPVERVISQWLLIGWHKSATPVCVLPKWCLIDFGKTAELSHLFQAHWCIHVLE